MRYMRRCLWALLIVLSFALPFHANARSRAVELISFEPVLTGQINIYSPETLGNNKLYVAGWRDPGQVEDKIYLSERNGSEWGALVEVFSKPGWHVNDPSIVQLKSGKLAMYYTALDLSCGTVNECHFTDNQIGLALSADGGYTWVDKGIVVGKNNGIDRCGGWSPTAIRDGKRVVVIAHGAFGHNGCPFVLYRWTFEKDGKTLRSVDTIQTPRFLDNVDVMVNPDGSCTLVGNEPSLTSIYYYTSGNCRQFSVPADNPTDSPLIASQYWVNTPHITPRQGGGFLIWFGFNAGALPEWYIPETHVWGFE